MLRYTGLEAAAIHAQFDTSSTTAGVPVDCGALVNAWRLGGFWRGNDDSAANLLRRNVDVEAPTGGLFGGASIINVLGGYQVSYSADAIDGFYTVGIDGLGIDDGRSRIRHARLPCTSVRVIPSRH